MPRFVVFDGAPTLEQCRKSLKLRPGFKGTWTTLPLPLPPPPSTSPRTRPPSSPPAVESQFQDADTTMQRNSRRTKASEGGKPPAASQFADADTTGLFSSSSRERVVAIKGEAQESEGEGPPTKRTKRFEESYQEEEEAEDLETNEAAPSFFLPPPSQPRPRHSLRLPTQPSQSFLHPSHLPSFRRSQPDHSAVSNATTSFYGDATASYEASYAPDGDSIGSPPRFDWSVSDLVRLNELRSKVGRTVHVLATVIDFKAAQEGSRQPSNVNLVDHTGQFATLVLWKQSGHVILEAIRRGDVIYIGKVTVKEYEKRMQLNFNNSTSQLQICWRSAILDVEEDTPYQWPEGWKEARPEARVVLEEKDYYKEFMGVTKAW